MLNLCRNFGSHLNRYSLVRFVFLTTVYAAIIGISIQFAFVLGFSVDPYGGFTFNLPDHAKGPAIHTAAWFIPFKLLVLWCFGQYKNMLFYFRLPDLLRIGWACLTASVVLLFIAQFWGWEYALPKRVILGELMMSVFLISSFRMAIRILRERYNDNHGLNKAKRVRVAIVGAGDIGEKLAAELKARRGLGMNPVVFMDTDENKQGSRIHGLRVIPVLANFQQLREDHGVKKVIIAIGNAPARSVQSLVSKAQAANMEIGTVPSLAQMASGQVSATKIRPVDLEDLLGRDPVKLDSEKISEMIQGKIVLVTGGGGSIGSELCRQILSSDPTQLLLVEQSEVQLYLVEQELIKSGYKGRFIPLVADIVDETRMRGIFKRYKPEMVFHAAAHKHVPMMESQPAEAVKNNSLGTAALANWASEYEVERFVLISTDKAINPTNAMGASKRMAEISLQATQQKKGNKTKFMAVRFGNVMGSSGSVIPLFKRQIEEGGPLTVTHADVTRYFMTIPEAVGLVLQSATYGEGGEIFVLDMGEPIRIVDVARQLIRLSGFEPDEDIEIKIVGLRPGEKLYEELKHEGEEYAETEHKRIFRFLSDPWEYETLSDCLKDFDQKIHSCEPNQVKELLNLYIPEYKPYIV